LAIPCHFYNEMAVATRSAQFGFYLQLANDVFLSALSHHIFTGLVSGVITAGAVAFLSLGFRDAEKRTREVRDRIETSESAIVLTSSQDLTALHVVRDRIDILENEIILIFLGHPPSRRGKR
jgi:hypothetical protein